MIPEPAQSAVEQLAGGHNQRGGMVVTPFVTQLVDLSVASLEALLVDQIEAPAGSRGSWWRLGLAAPAGGCILCSVGHSVDDSVGDSVGEDPSRKP